MNKQPAQGVMAFITIWLGQLFSILGSVMTRFALGIWVLQETDSVTSFTLILFFSTLLGGIALPLAGVIGDRLDRRRIMILTDTVAAVATVVVLALLLTDRLAVWHIYVAVGVQSIAGNIQFPAYSAAIPMLIPKRHLGRANGAVQISGALSNIVGPILAAALLGFVGLRGVIVFDLLSFLFAVTMLLFVHIPKPKVSAEGAASRGTVQYEMGYGFKYVWRRPGLFGLLLYFAIVNFALGTTSILMTPLVLSFADEQTLGWVLSVVGAASLIGSLIMMTWGGPKRRVLGIMIPFLLSALGMIVMSLRPEPIWIAVGGFIAMVTLPIASGSSRSIWHVKVEPDLQGRIASVRLIVSQFTLPIAYLLAGPLIDYVLEPSMQTGGRMAQIFGSLIGTGDGRGIALLILLVSILPLFGTVVAYFYRPFRNVEDDLPDQLQDESVVTAQPPQRRKPTLIGNTMNKIRRWTTRIALGLVVLVAVALIAFQWWARRPFPQMDGEVVLDGLQAEVTVIRDEYGVPQIYAENDLDLLFAQGYVHAQDRLWQMEVFRRSAAGTMAEVVGEQALTGDIFSRNLLLRESAERQFAAMNEEETALLNAYSAGVNAYMTEYDNKLPLEFQILRYKPDPWTPVDSISWGNQLSRHLASNRRLEHLRAAIVKDYGVEAMELLFPEYGEGTPTTIPQGWELYDNLVDLPDESVMMGLDVLGDTYSGIGSNAFVASGEVTESGMPLLASDLHLGVTMPAGWYAQGLHGGSFDLVGYTMPGVPLILTGHNANIAWGPTNLGPDTQDLFMERLDDNINPSTYEFMGEMLPLETTVEVFNVKGSDPVERTFYATHHGPILYYTLPGWDGSDVEESESDELPMSMAWTLYGEARLFRAILGITRASNWDEFRAASSIWDIPGQNMLYADTAGNIGYQATGAIPLRENHDGLLPVPGWTGEYDWDKTIPFEELPSVYNPPGGMIASANSRLTDDDYPYRLSDSYTPGYRLARIYELMEEKAPLSAQDMWDLQGDNYANHAAKYIDFILPTLSANSAEEEQALTALREWDLFMDVDSAATTVYSAFHMKMLENLLYDNFGDIGPWYIQGHYIRHNSQSLPMLLMMMENPTHEWWDDINTPELETRDEILQRSFEDGVAWLVDQQGSNVDDWVWGNVHATNFPHIVFGQHWLFGRLFNADEVPKPGGNFTVNTHAFIWTNPFDVWIVPIKAEVIDLADFDATMAVGATGQNGNLYHPHREDVIELWTNHESHLLPSSREVVDERAENILILRPAE